MKIHLTPREQRRLLGIGALALFILWVYSSSIIQPLFKENTELGQQVQIARDRLRGLEAVASNEGALQQQQQQLQQTVKSLRSLLPAEKELPVVIERLSDIASQAQVKIQTISPQRTAPSPGAQRSSGKSSDTQKDAPSDPLVYKEVTIQIDALAGFHQLGTFLGMIESSDNPMQVNSLRVSGDPKEPKRHRIKFILKSFFATEGDVPGGSSGMPAESTL